MKFHVDAEHFPKCDIEGNGVGTATWVLVESFEAADVGEASTKFVAIKAVERYYKAKDPEGLDGQALVTLYRLVQDDTGEQIEQGGGDVDTGAAGDKTGGAGLIVDPPPPPPPPPVDPWEQYYPWIYAAVAIGIAAFIIYLMFFGKNPIINRVQDKVVS